MGRILLYYVGILNVSLEILRGSYGDFANVVFKFLAILPGLRGSADELSAVPVGGSLEVKKRKQNGIVSLESSVGIS